jgi:hemerythrin-like domain-containing protein
MRRSPELTPLSHVHHVALEHALRLRRADDDDVAAVTARFRAFFAEEGERHLQREEEVLVPALAGAEALRERLLAEHALIRQLTRALGGSPRREDVHALGLLLTDHVRFEERELFPLLEARLTAGELAAVGRRLAA